MIQPNQVVMIDHEGTALLCIVLGEKKGKVSVLTERGRELELQGSRLYVVMPSGGMVSKPTQKERLASLAELRSLAEAEMGTISVQTLWELVSGDFEEISAITLAELLFKQPTLVQYVAVRLLLLGDRIYFKRNKDTFSPRDSDLVEELRAQAEIQKKKLEKRRRFLDWIVATLKSPTALSSEFSEEVSLLTSLACDEGLAPHEHKESAELLLEALKAAHIQERHNVSDAAYDLLERVKIFNAKTNPVLIKHNLPQELFSGSLEVDTKLHAVQRQDFTDRPSLTVDDESTQDMDDAISLVEMGEGYELGIHITDVASYIKEGSQLDKHASRRGTSVYLPETTINMLPREICEEKLSLIPNSLRDCISVIVQLTKEGDIIHADVLPTKIKLKNKLSYTEVDKMIFSGDKIWGLIKDFTSKFEAKRMSQGGFRVPKKDIQPEVDDDGVVRLVEYDESAPARSMIGELMVLANSVFANFCAAHELAIPYRTQDALDKESLKAISEFPEGQVRDFALRTKLKRSLTLLKPGLHATLGLNAYTQATSPIRRYLDIVVQRQILSWFVSQKPYYSEKEVEEILVHLDEPLQRAGSATRGSRRYWILKYLEQRAKKNRSIEGTVVRVEGKNPLVELEEIYLAFPVKSEEKLKLGDKVKVEMLQVDAKRDYTRFEVKKRAV